MLEAAILGSRGYMGRTLVSLLLDHPAFTTPTLASESAAGTPYGQAVPAFGHIDELVLVSPQDPTVAQADVLFLATDDQTALAYEERGLLDEADLVVDLSRAHRSQALQGAGWTYGLPELAPGIPEGTGKIAAPGCYPTAALLATGPALAYGLAGPGPLIVDGKSGVSGAGASPRPDLHFAETHESLRAYKVLGHDHEAEIQGGVTQLSGQASAPTVRFTPHLVPQNRGLLVTAYLALADGVTGEEVEALYAKAYGDQALVRLVDEADTAHVKGSVLADVAVDVHEETGLLVARCAIDNLLKGGAGQALQAANLALGLPSTAGLPTVGGGP